MNLRWHSQMHTLGEESTTTDSIDQRMTRNSRTDHLPFCQLRSTYANRSVCWSVHFMIALQTYSNQWSLANYMFTHTEVKETIIHGVILTFFIHSSLFLICLTTILLFTAENFYSKFFRDETNPLYMREQFSRSMGRPELRRLSH